MPDRPLAVVTGASSGIGLEFARLCAARGYDLVIAADEAQISTVAESLRHADARVWEIEADLSTAKGVEALVDVVRRLARPVDVLIANAGRGLGGPFLDQDPAQQRLVLDTNVTGTIYLVKLIGQDMRSRGAGRILIVSSIAGFIPGVFQAIYHGTKAFLDNFAEALRNELQGSGVSVTCLMPGATETEFFRRAGMLNTKIGQQRKADPADVARDGFEALMEGRAAVVSGWSNKLRVALARILPASVLAERNRDLASRPH